MSNIDLFHSDFNLLNKFLKTLQLHCYLKVYCHLYMFLISIILIACKNDCWVFMQPNFCTSRGPNSCIILTLKCTHCGSHKCFIYTEYKCV